MKQLHQSIRHQMTRLILLQTLFAVGLVGIIILVLVLGIGPEDLFTTISPLLIALIFIAVLAVIGGILLFVLTKHTAHDLENALSTELIPLTKRLAAWRQGDVRSLTPAANYVEFSGITSEIQKIMESFRTFSFEEYRLSATLPPQVAFETPKGAISYPNFSQTVATYLATYGGYYQNALVVFRLANLDQVPLTLHDTCFQYFQNRLERAFPKALFTHNESEFLLLIRTTPTPHLLETQLQTFVQENFRLVVAEQREIIIELKMGIAYNLHDGMTYEELQEVALKRAENRSDVTFNQTLTNFSHPLSQKEKRIILYRCFDKVQSIFQTNTGNSVNEETWKQALHTIVLALGIEQVGIALSSPKTMDLVIMRYEHNTEFDPKILTVFAKDISAYDALYNGNDLLYSKASDSLPPFLRNYTRNAGIGALLHRRIRNNGNTIGFIYFHEVPPSRVWSNDELEILTSLTTYLATLLHYEFLYQNYLEKNEILNQILQQEKSHLYSIKSDSYELQEFSNSLKNIFPEVQKNEICYHAFYKQKAPCKNCPIKKGHKEEEPCNLLQISYLRSLIFSSENRSTIFMKPQKKGDVDSNA